MLGGVPVPVYFFNLFSFVFKDYFNLPGINSYNKNYVEINKEEKNLPLFSSSFFFCPLEFGSSLLIMKIFADPDPQHCS